MMRWPFKENNVEIDRVHKFHRLILDNKRTIGYVISYWIRDLVFKKTWHEFSFRA